MGFLAWSCGSDVEETPSPTTTGSGGGGGATASSSSQASSSSGMMTFDNVCEEACFHVEDCSVAGACALLAAQFGIDLSDCSMEVSECSAQCVVDAECGQLLSLAGDMPDAELLGCLLPCQGECYDCAVAECGPQVEACFGDPECGQFAVCLLQNCPDFDDECVVDCQTMFQSQATDNLVICMGGNCDEACMGAGGAGGAGGQGGSPP
jgi:hypothetical protein